LTAFLNYGPVSTLISEEFLELFYSPLNGAAYGSLIDTLQIANLAISEALTLFSKPHFDLALMF